MMRGCHSTLRFHRFATGVVLLVPAARMVAQCPDRTPPPCRATQGAAAPKRANPLLDDRTWIVVLLEGRPVAAGDYSLWLVPRALGPWTLILSRAAHVFHKPYPGSADDALRVDVTPEPLSHLESLAIYFPVVLRDEALMRIHWGTTGVTVRIKAPYRPESP